MSKNLTDKVSFAFIRYANCWEDANILLEGLNPKPGGKILSIGSAGDNSFSLLVSEPDLVLAVDVNKIQLHLIELKKVGIEELSHGELLAFLGFRPASSREATFHSLKNSLREETRKYWEHHIKQIREGVISQGKFEHYFQLFSKRVLPWIHSKKTTEQLLQVKSAAEQQVFYDKHWNTWRWRLLFKIFFSKFVMGRFGRDPEFLREVKLSVGEYIFQKAAKQLQSVLAQNNFILRYNLTGNYGDMLPHYLQPQNFEKIKSNIHKIKLLEGYAEDAFRQYGQFDYMNLSDIFEYMDQSLFEKVAQQLTDNTLPNGRLAYWNLMVPRRISEILPQKMAHQQTLSQTLSDKDKGFFYNQFVVEEKI